MRKQIYFYLPTTKPESKFFARSKPILYLYVICIHLAACIFTDKESTFLK